MFAPVDSTQLRCLPSAQISLYLCFLLQSRIVQSTITSYLAAVKCNFVVIVNSFVNFSQVDVQIPGSAHGGIPVS